MYTEDMSRSYTIDSSAKTQELVVRLNSMCRVYEQADRVLTGDPVKVHVVDEPGSAPAWSDGEAIYINKDQISDFDIDELIQINGLNYHELSHHLYSPRKGTTMMQWVMEQDRVTNGLAIQACNILEDQRIETLLVARYPAIAPYLTSTVIRWLTDSPEAMMSNYLSIRGRRYLPLELRIAFRDMFIKQDLIPVIADIVDQYRVLAFPRDYNQAQELISRFVEEVLIPLQWQSDDHSPAGCPPVSSNQAGGPDGCGVRKASAKGRPEPGKAQNKDAERAKGMGQAEPQYTPKPKEEQQGQGEEEGYGESTESPNVNNSTMPGVSPGQGEFTPPTTAEEAIRNRNVDLHSSGQYGTGHGESLGGIPDDVLEIMRNIEQSIANRTDVQQDVKTKQKVIIGGDGKHTDSIKTGKYDSIDVNSSVLMAARRFSRELERLKQECEPSWMREMPSGRVNVQRVIAGCEIDKAFDRWDEGNDGTDIEAVMLIDRSGSMSSNNNDMRASEAAWVIKRALEQIDAPVTVYAFDDNTEIVFTRDQKANRVQMPFVYGNGGTDPHNSLVSTERLFKSSRRNTKIMFLVTDGDFQHHRNDEIIKRMNSQGILTVLVLIADDDTANWVIKRAEENQANPWHECQIHGVINKAEELLPFAKQIVTSTIKKASMR